MSGARQPDWEESGLGREGDISRPSQGLTSIIVVNYNGGDQVLECLRSLEAGGGERQEIIVVDNASQDGSAEGIEKCFPEVRLVRAGSNLGFGGGNNLGASQARGEYLAFANPDTRVEAGWLESLRLALERNPRAGMATARILLSKRPDTVNACGNEVHLSGLTLCRGMGQPRRAYDTAGEVGAVSGAAFLIRRELFERLEGFDASFFLYMEDSDLSLRARLAGWCILYVPEAVVYHDYELRFGRYKVYYQERNRYRMLLKVFRWRTLLALLPTLLLAEVVTWGFVLSREPQRVGNKLGAYATILRDWVDWRKARSCTQRLRKICDRDVLESNVHRLSFEQVEEGFMASLAHLVFDPLFHVFHNLTVRVVHW